MLSLHNVTVTFSGEDLFSGITFRLDKGDKVGLIGNNGAGKSTLLKVIAGTISCNTGKCSYNKDISVGFLSQDLDFKAGLTVLEEAYQAFSEILNLEKQIDLINKELAQRSDFESKYYHKLMIQLSESITRYELLGGYSYKGDVEKTLQGLGFKHIDFDKLTDTFSGGWRMRIELAKLLLQKHDILLLDEPTNHLDIESIIWLEDFLKNYSGAIMLVSHDKMFLDNITNRSIEISLGKIYDYKKPYSKFIAYREELRKQQASTLKNQEKKIKKTEQLIERFRYKANKASMAQSLIKKLDKIERIEVDNKDSKSMKLHFPEFIQPGKVVIQTKELSKSYGEYNVFSKVNIEVSRGDHIAFVGQNGQGKSTLAKVIVGQNKAKGYLKIGHNVKLGYFAQDQSEHLDKDKTVLQVIEDASNQNDRIKARDMLGAFLFSGEDVEKKVKVLSGGERNRLALCKMLLNPFNVLIMDEPTNHLDMASKEILKNALLHFKGTLIVISHDRDFLKGLVSSIYYFKNKLIKAYPGDIDEFLQAYNLESLREAEKLYQDQKPIKTEHPKKKKKYQKVNESDKDLKKLQNKLNEIERIIAITEKKIKKMDAEISSNYNIVSKDMDFFLEYEQEKKNLKIYMEQWIILENKISTFQ